MWWNLPRRDWSPPISSCTKPKPWWYVHWLSFENPAGSSGGLAMQVVAANIVVISVALLATTLVVLSPTWQGFLRYIGLLSAQSRREIRTPLYYSLGVSAAVFGSVIAMGIVDPYLVQSAAFFVMLGLAVLGIGYIAVLFTWNLLRHRRFPRFRRSEEPEVKPWEKAGTLAYTLSLVHLVFAAFLFAVCVIGAIDTTVGISLGPNTAEDFDFSRWTLRAATMAFFFGLLLFGFGRFVDFQRLVAPADEEARESVPEGYGLGGHDEA